MARGEDLALFNTYRPNIQNLLRHSCLPESSHNLWIGLYRIGTTEDEAKTFVVVSCSDSRIRKLTRGLLNSCSIFQPGEALDRFKVISKATLPETACEPQQTMQDDEELPCILYEAGLLNKNKDKNMAMAMEKCKTTICIHPSNTGDSYLCRSVRARQMSEQGELRSQTATAGPSSTSMAGLTSSPWHMLLTLRRKILMRRLEVIKMIGTTGTMMEMIMQVVVLLTKILRLGISLQGAT